MFDSLRRVLELDAFIRTAVDLAELFFEILGLTATLGDETKFEPQEVLAAEFSEFGAFFAVFCDTKTARNDGAGRLCRSFWSCHNCPP